jgi:hypothetical protein
MSDHRAIEAEFQNACTTPSDMNEHMETLRELTAECDHIIEAGVRYVVSSWAFILGCACRGGTVVSYCWNRLPEIDRALQICGLAKVPWYFHDGDWLDGRLIPETDLLFIDMNHFYEQLTRELASHGGRARKYIVLHDTVRFGETGADGKRPGLWQAVEELVAAGEWEIKRHYTNCNGLTVLERVKKGVAQ